LSASRGGRAPLAAVGAVAACLLTAGWFAAQARAIYGPAAGGFGAEIVSVDNASDEQGNAGTTDAVISGNGRYVVFQTRATNFFENDGGVAGPHSVESDAEPLGTLREGGIFRYDRDTGQIQLVADGSEIHTEGPEKGKLIFRGAQNPSVSADGRYIAFSTAQKLVPQDTNENVDVYVRDMNVPLTADRQTSGAYQLVSAVNGSAQPPVYGPPSQPVVGDLSGAEIWPSTSISADGSKVVFRVPEVTSNLPVGTAVVQPEQLFVRDVPSQTTTLVSHDLNNSGEAAGGAVGPVSISGDGTTVSWAATNAPAQTRFLPGESLNASQPYYLWQRWAESGVTRRITGLVDPDDPACPEGESITQNPFASGPCYGPLSEQESSLASIEESPPALSANGYTVAFLAGAALRPNITKSSGLDLFVTSMAPGATRKNSTRELTLGVSSGNPGSTPSIESIAMSPDGSTIAFTSLRDDFVLPEPLPIGSFRAAVTSSDLYVVNLHENTLERALLSSEGGDPNGSVGGDPSLSGDGSLLAFTSSAANLISGDANRAPDAFVVARQHPAGTAAPPAEVNSMQSGFALSTTVSPELGLHVRQGKGGSLLLLVETPGAGRISAQARGAVPAPKAKSKSRSGHRKKSKPVVLGRVATTVRAEGTATLVLKLSAKYGNDLKRLGKLQVAITVNFEPASPGEALSAEARATFASASARKARRSATG
jgi:Tol biopolymer transport system component